MNVSPLVFSFEITFCGYWHAGTGEAGAGDLDAVILRDSNRLPYFPGKALKGLFSEAFCEWIAVGSDNPAHPGEEDVALLFGTAGNRSATLHSQLRFTNATLASTDQQELIRSQLQDGLTTSIASTALQNGIARERTLRRIEVAIPMTLSFDISWLPSENSARHTGEQICSWLEHAARRIQMAGAHRHNGLGECRVAPIPRDNGGTPSKSPTEPGSTADPFSRVDDGARLVRIPFVLETLEPVVLGETAATTGTHQCLDFISGSSLLGAFARHAYSRLGPGSETAFHAFHSGSTRFGDAHPLPVSGIPAFPLPASWYFDKDAAGSGGVFGEIDGKLDTNALVDLARQERPPGKNLKQARGQWFSGEGTRTLVRHRHHLKSARDSEMFGRPEPSQLFGYQSIEAGQHFAGEIHIRQDLVSPAVIDLLTEWIAGQPTIFIGRSRTAEFGSCRLRPAQVPPFPSVPVFESSDRLVLYALSDLCPDGTELLPSDGGAWHPDLAGFTLVPNATHVRIREYARWNGFRGCPDPSTRVIQRGGVLVFRPPQNHTPDVKALQTVLDRDGIGAGLQHGAGRVLVNPDFSLLPKNPLPVLDRVSSTEAAENTASPPETSSILVALARKRLSSRTLEIRASGIAERIIEKWKHFKPLPSPSQWSRLRQIAAGSMTFAQFIPLADRMMNQGASRRIWLQATHGHNPRPLLKEILDGSPARPSEFLLQLTADHQPEADRERLLLLALAEACRQLRLKLNTEANQH